MLTAHSLEEFASLSDPRVPTVATIGNYDGVHLGHQSIIREVRARARELHARSVVITFDPHPAHLLRAGHGVPRTQLITPLPRKLELLADTGVDVTLVLPFTEELRTLSARHFAQRILCEALRTIEIHEGESFRFGHRAEADIAGLTELGREFCFSVVAHRPVILRRAPVSSSRIRTALKEGQLNVARALLGRPYSLDSTPAKGRGYGTRYTVPTINLDTPAESLLADGVYTTVLQIGTGEGARSFQGITNAGKRPTFGADSYAIETHLFHFVPVELTQTTPLRLSILKRLRDERRFPNPDELRRQIGRDVLKAQRFFHLCALAEVQN